MDLNGHDLSNLFFQLNENTVSLVVAAIRAANAAVRFPFFD